MGGSGKIGLDGSDHPLLLSRQLNCKGAYLYCPPCSHDAGRVTAWQLFCSARTTSGDVFWEVEGAVGEQRAH